MACLSEQDCIDYNVTVVQAGCHIAGRRVKDDELRDATVFAEGSWSFAPTATDFYNVFGSMLSQTSEIICITYSAKLSIAYSNATTAALGFKGRNISVVDSNSAAGAILIMIKMCRDLENSGVGYTDIVRILTAQRGRINGMLSLDNFDIIKKAGKIVLPAGNANTAILNRRPYCLFTDSGEINFIKFSDGRLGSISDIMAEIKEPRRIVCCYSDESPMTYQLRDKLKETYPEIPLDTRKFPASLRVVIGDYAVGVFYLKA